MMPSAVLARHDQPSWSVFMQTPLTNAARFMRRGFGQERLDILRIAVKAREWRNSCPRYDPVH